MTDQPIRDAASAGLADGGRGAASQAHVWEAAVCLRLDGKRAELAEANDLLEEAGELLQRARRKTAARGDEAVENLAKTPPASKAPAKKPPASKPPATRATARTAAVKPKAPSPKAKGGAKKTTARGRSGRKK
jgi:hypothetical protein